MPGVLLDRQYGYGGGGGGGGSTSGGGAAAGGGGAKSGAAPSAAQLAAGLQGEYLYLYGVYWYYFAFAAFIGLLFLLQCIRLLTHAARRGAVVPSGDGSGGYAYRPRLPPLALAAAESLWTTALARPAFGGMSVFELLTTMAIVGWEFFLLFFNEFPQGVPGLEQLGFISKRGGSLAVANMVVAFALAGRNNVLEFLTGVEYNALRWVHKLIGFMTWLMAAFHGISYLTMTGKAGGPSAFWALVNSELGYTGITALSGVTALFLGSLWFVRKHAYEFFLWSHVLGYVTFIVGLFYHRPDRRPQVYACIALIAFERLMRVVRKVKNQGMSSPIVQARAECIAGAIILKVPYQGSWSAGSHAYIMPWHRSFASKPWRLWQAHPWSIANVPFTGAQALGTRGKGTTNVGDDKEYWTASMADASEPGPQEMLFVIRVKQGMTRVMADLVRSGTKERGGWGITMPVSLEGPYPSTVVGAGVCGVDMDKFENVILFAGGSGVTHTLSMLLEMIQRARAGVAGHCLGIDFVWVLQEAGQIAWIAEYLETALGTGAPLGIKVGIHLFVTKPTPSMDAVDSLLSQQVRTLCSIQAGRPDIAAAVRDVVGISEGSVLAVACGPQSMSDGVQKACASVNEPGAVWHGDRARYVKCVVAKFE